MIIIIIITIIKILQGLLRQSYMSLLTLRRSAKNIHSNESAYIKALMETAHDLKRDEHIKVPKHQY